MRPRFSLRLALAVVALLSVALYVLCRPTSVANHFVAAVDAQDFAAARRLLWNEAHWNRVIGPDDASELDHIYADLMPCEWQDLWSAQRRIVLRLARHKQNGDALIDWTEDFDVVARPNGLRIMLPANTNFNWPEVPKSPPAIINRGEGTKLEPKQHTS